MIRDTRVAGRLPIGRLIGALVIALIGLGMYMFNTQVNPVTGREAARRHERRPGDGPGPPGRTPDGQPDGRRRRSRRGSAPPSSTRSAGDSSETATPARAPTWRTSTSTCLRDPKTINAFALPGGQVFITAGLLDRLENEAQLAGVLGHEIGHVINRHSAQQMAKGQLGQILTVAVGVGASDDRGGGRNAQLVAAMVNQMSQLRFSREDESRGRPRRPQVHGRGRIRSQRDARRDERPQGSQQGPSTPEFLATHPLPETRLEQILAAIKEAYPNGIPSNLTKGRTLRRAPGRPHREE